MNTHRMTAIMVGVFYIIGTVAGVLSVVFSGSILDDPEYLTSAAANANQLVLSSLMVLTMGASLAMVPVLMYPVSKERSPALAMGYVVFRGALETAAYIAAAISTLLLTILSRNYVAADMPDGFGFEAQGLILAESGDWIGQVGTIFFILGALMFYWVLYRARLVPRWISGWGLIAAIPYLVSAFLVIFGITKHFTTLDSALQIPLGVQEMVLAVWLIVKGFNPSAIASEPA